MKLRKGLCYVLVGASALIQWGGCIPFLPGLFGMMCLESGGKGMLFLCTILGIAATVPWVDAIRYILTIIIIGIGSVLLERIRGCRESMPMAVLTFAAVLSVGIGGSLMQSSVYGVLSVVLEAVFAFGLVLTFNRFVHWFLTPREKLYVMRVIPEDERDERIKNCVAACQKLAQVFAVPKYEYAAVQKEKEERIGSLSDYVVTQSRTAIAQQLLAIATNMEKCTQQGVYLCKEDQQTIRRLEYDLKENGICGREFTLYEDEEGRHHLEFMAHTLMGQTLSLKNISELIREVVDMPMVARQDMKMFLNREERKLAFVETGRFQVIFGHKKSAGAKERICGDNDFFSGFREGRMQALGISDGMGMGPQASKESEQVLEVVEELLSAGFLPEQALPMLNGACAMRREEQGCSTLDLCMVDTFTGMGSWYKMGAAASFLRKKDKVEILYGNTLPIGALEHSMVFKQERQLEDGDILVLMTDGAIEALPSEKPEEWMRDIIKEVTPDTPNEMAKEIWEKVTSACETEPRDDMLIAVLRIWER